MWRKKTAAPLQFLFGQSFEPQLVGDEAEGGDAMKSRDRLPIVFFLGRRFVFISLSK